MSEVKQEQTPVSIEKILGHYLVGDLTRLHEQEMIGMQKLGLSDEQLKETARALKSDRQLVAELKMDDLTGLPKNSACRAVIEKGLVDSSNQGKVAVGFNDFVYLHGINKQIGHERTNDEVFKPIAEIYQRLMVDYFQRGKKVIIGRYAGDSFLTVIIGQEREAAEEIFKEIARAEKSLKRPEGAAMKPIFSHGYAFSEEFPEIQARLEADQEGEADKNQWKQEVASSLIEKADQEGEADKNQWKQELARRARKNPDGKAAKLLEALQIRK